MTTNDQRNYGFKLGAVTLADGKEAEYPYLEGAEDEVNDHLDNLDWDGLVGEDKGGYATVAITDERIAELAAQIQKDRETRS